MLFKKLQKNMLLFSLLLNIHSIQCMEKSDTKIYQFDEQDLSLIETMPNELLFLIFYFKIDAIINSNNASQGKEEFKAFLSVLRLTNRKLHSFGDELKKYFVMYKKPEISGVKFNKVEVRFKFGVKEYIINEEDPIIDMFLQEVLSLNDNVLKKIGEIITQEIETIVLDQNDREKALAKLFSTIIYASYTKAEDEGNKEEAMAKIRVLVKPLLAAYPNHADFLWQHNLKKYSFNKDDLN